MLPQTLTLDLNAMLPVALIALTGFFVMELRKPGQQQQQLLMMGAIAAGGFLLRRFEQGGNQQDAVAVQLAAMDAKTEERFRTLFGRMDAYENWMRDVAEHLPHVTRRPRRK